MTQRHCKVPHEFVCFTEDKVGIDPAITIQKLPSFNVEGWWYKPYFFSKDIPLQGTILYFDLDVIVFRNIDNLFTYKPGAFCIIRDFNRSIRKDFDRFNSSVFRLQTGMYDNVWQSFINNTVHHVQRNRGDQDWMYKNIRNFTFWPDEWIQSYKWEMRDRRDLSIFQGKRNFVNDNPPKILNETSVAVFHGEPNPGNANDTWVKDNWK
jgi:hypothetical protein